MNPLIMSALSKIAQNKHTTGAAVVYGVAKWACPIASTWCPSHKAQIDTTAGYLEGAAIFYGFTAAGDSAKSVTKDEADTTFVKKSDVTPKP